MEEKVLQARAEFNRVIDFVTGEALTLELHCVEVEVFRMLLRLGWLPFGGSAQSPQAQAFVPSSEVDDPLGSEDNV